MFSVDLSDLDLAVLQNCLERYFEIVLEETEKMRSDGEVDYVSRNRQVLAHVKHLQEVLTK